MTEKEKATIGGMVAGRTLGTALKVLYHTNTRKKPYKTMPLLMLG